MPSAMVSADLQGRAAGRGSSRMAVGTAQGTTHNCRLHPTLPTVWCEATARPRFIAPTIRQLQSPCIGWCEHWATHQVKGQDMFCDKVVPAAQHDGQPWLLGSVASQHERATTPKQSAKAGRCAVPLLCLRLLHAQPLPLPTAAKTPVANSHLSRRGRRVCL